MRKVPVAMFRITGILSIVTLISACSIDSSSDLNEEVDQLVEEQRTEDAELDQAAEQSSSQSSSSTPSQASAAPSSAAAPSSSSVGGGFIWKPVSEGDGRLVILLPATLRGKVASCGIYKGSALVERGRFSGDTHNGGRPHFRFSKPGAGYGTGLTVIATSTSGQKYSWSIASGAQRVG